MRLRLTVSCSTSSCSPASASSRSDAPLRRYAARGRAARPVRRRLVLELVGPGDLLLRVEALEDEIDRRGQQRRPAARADAGMRASARAAPGPRACARAVRGVERVVDVQRAAEIEPLGDLAQVGASRNSR